MPQPKKKPNKKKKNVKISATILTKPEQDLLEILVNDYYHGWTINNSTRKANLAQIGVRLLQTRDYTHDRENKKHCDYYIFWELLKLSWYKEYRRDLVNLGSQNLFLKTENYLGKKGFKLVGSPKAGDIVMYMTRNKEEIARLGINNKQVAAHVGIYRGDKKVESKFGTGDVYLHPINFILPEYGDRVLFFRA